MGKNKNVVRDGSLLQAEPLERESTLYLFQGAAQRYFSSETYPTSRSNCISPHNAINSNGRRVKDASP